MKKFLIISSLLMSTAFAADNELAEKQSSTCRSGSILSMIGYCLGYQNEPEVTKAPRAVVAEEVIPVTIIPFLLFERLYSGWLRVLL